jgi:SRSO17 transposase
LSFQKNSNYLPFETVQEAGAAPPFEGGRFQSTLKLPPTDEKSPLYFIIGAVKRPVPFVSHFSRYFHSRSDHSVDGVRNYVIGLLMAKRGAKNIERMEEAVEGFEYQNVHHAISDSPWEHRPLMDELARQADGLLGGGQATRLVIDDSGFAKKGQRSVGVSRQYSGRDGKVDNCQIAVCTSLASGQHSTLIDIRLYLPPSWTDDQARCAAAGIPEGERAPLTKVELALASVRHQRSLGVRFGRVSADSDYGSQPAFLHGLDDLGETFVAEVHCDQTCWLEAPWRHRQGARSGSILTHLKSDQPAVRVDQWARDQRETAWERLKVRHSDQGWVEVNYLAQRVWPTDGADEKGWWLLAWENPDEGSTRHPNGNYSPPRRHYALSNAGAEEGPRRLISDGVGRNVAERNFRDGKIELGMADYQTRGWRPWQHHMALVMLAMLFTLREKMHWGSPAAPLPEEEPALTTGDLVLALKLPLLPRCGESAPPEEAAPILTAPSRKRQQDQTQKQAKTKKERPPLGPVATVPND